MSTGQQGGALPQGRQQQQQIPPPIQIPTALNVIDLSADGNNDDAVMTVADLLGQDGQEDLDDFVDFDAGAGQQGASASAKSSKKSWASGKRKRSPSASPVSSAKGRGPTPKKSKKSSSGSLPGAGAGSGGAGSSSKPATRSFGFPGEGNWDSNVSLLFEVRVLLSTLCPSAPFRYWGYKGSMLICSL
jgi:hypothetical protein